MLRSTLLFGAVLGVFAAAPAYAEKDTATERASPRGWLESKVKQAHKLATRKVEPDSPGERKWQAEAKVLIDDILDWEELTRKSLGSNWRKIDEKQQQRFSRLLRQLIEASYKSRLKSAVRDNVSEPKDVSVDWLEEDVDEKKASLVAKVSAGDKNVLLGFELRWTEERWRVFDVSVDDLSTVRTYRSNFNKIIKKQGWPELISRLERKIGDIEAGRADLTRSGLGDEEG